MIERIYKCASAGLSHKYRTTFKRTANQHSKCMLHVQPNKQHYFPVQLESLFTIVFSYDATLLVRIQTAVKQRKTNRRRRGQAYQLGVTCYVIF